MTTALILDHFGNKVLERKKFQYRTDARQWIYKQLKGWMEDRDRVITNSRTDGIKEYMIQTPEGDILDFYGAIKSQ